MKPAMVLWHQTAMKATGLHQVAQAAPSKNASESALLFTTASMLLLFVLLSLGINLYLWYQHDKAAKLRAAARTTGSSGHPSTGATRAPPMSKEELLSLLLQCTHQEVQWVLRGVVEAHGPLFPYAAVMEAAVSEERSRSEHGGPSRGIQRERSMSLTADAGTMPLTARAAVSAGSSRAALTTKALTPETQPVSPEEHSVRSVVRFSALNYYVFEGEDAKLRVVRSGNLREHSTVRYRSTDGSAVAGLKYAQLDGTLNFKPGEYEKEIVATVYENEEYGPSTEFKVELLHDEALENAIIDGHLQSAWVQIIEDDLFPTNACNGPERSGIPSPNPEKKFQQLTRLLVEFIRFALADRVIFSGMRKMLLADQCENVYGFLNLLMSVYLVDFVVKTSVPESMLIMHSRRTSLVLVVATMVLPLFALHGLSYLRQSWGTAGRARAVMQTALLRKFLEYSADVRTELNTGDVLMAATHDIFVLVDKGLLQVCVVFKQLGSLMMLQLFQFIAPVLFDRPLRVWLVGCNSILPVLFCMLARLRFQKSTKCLEDQHETEAALASSMHETVLMYPLIADYNRRPFFVERYGKTVQDVNAATRQSSTVMTNNKYLGDWLTTLTVALFTFFGGLLVISDSMTLGMFLANVNIFKSVGSASTGVYSSWLDVQRVLPSLMRITELLNKPVDVDERKNFSDRCERLSQEQLACRVKEGAESTEILNLIPIRFSDVSVQYHTRPTPITFQGSVVIKQGSFVVVMGPCGAGKSTFLKLLCGAVLPDDTTGIFVPSHLRVLKLDQEVLFFEGSLMDNLTFGIKRGHRGGEEARVRHICEKVGLSEGVLSHLGSRESLDWISVLSNMEKLRLNLARALISSPHVLLLQRPTSGFIPPEEDSLLDVLCEFVHKRGVEEDDSALPWALRPACTCIVESVRHNVIRRADQVICISQGSIQTVDTAG
eukprot:CAMPEP_0179095334 /NCGR_PEP_ID=MMETSP0796-20121207/43766_1 /TAXON_ID=73915 /ORGANISM="Pyrodinium bahamense, Strain pbaha01" /LENGTH=944 /DNA_ID=CAMNT_0020793021 /DNA_START=40 /DNA_END=2870 /DNA_ORIENTATION=+